ncbi:MAG: PVC-type heme-binding CxxCH protein [Isosphaeraceae bacterium]
MRFARCTFVALGLSVVLSSGSSRAQGQEPIPHNQTRAPNKALSPQEAIRAMKVPPGFSVELVASEPDLVNPVAMTFDERGRIWVTESLEYPRRAPGPGRDRVKVLEDTDGDGKVDKVSIFAEGLNIPSGIAVGHGGVWVANSPDILFLQDTDGDGRADRREVIVTGFGRDDTHELPNSMVWGPDGWLYGWNGVFNPSHVEYRGKTYDFTCAIFRIHPRTRDFEVWCEGTSNPWGIAFDREGSAFASACVIDHLWHLTESGSYLRQGGPYPPYTWRIESIVDHAHQKAAYCGIHYYDSDTYPEAYRGKLFMGNIHGNCVNLDGLVRNGSTYRATTQDDFLTANDAWFMPVSQKTGPDGCLYILDWYDRYHCYQDANRDPAGIDRLKGRLYRVRYKDAPRRAGFDLSTKSVAELVGLLDSGNGYDRDTARRLLVERKDANVDVKLTEMVLDPKSPRRARLGALWTLVSRGPVATATLMALFDDADPTFRAWAVRAAGNTGKVDETLRSKLVALAKDRSPDVQLQVAIAARKVTGVDAVSLLTSVAASCGNDPLIPHIVWQNLHPLLESEGRRFAGILDAAPAAATPPALMAIVPRAVDRLLGSSEPDMAAVTSLLRRLLEQDRDASERAIIGLANRMESQADERGPAPELRGLVEAAIRTTPPGSLAEELKLLAAYWRLPGALEAARAALIDPDRQVEQRLRAFAAVRTTMPESEVVELARPLLSGKERAEFRGRLIAALGRLQSAEVASVLLGLYPSLEPELKPRVVELLTQRPHWGKALLAAVGQGKVNPASVNVNQLRRLLATRDPELVKGVKERWGTVREGRNPGREQVVARMTRLLRSTPGDATVGAEVFKRLCAQCHKIYGEGQEVGPEITLNGRGSYDQLLSNVFDPSLVIGSAYQATTVALRDGRVLTGLLVEDSPVRVVLKQQGGKVEMIPRSSVEEQKLSPLSLMPEDVETQLKPQEIADLFAYITLDRPPTDPKARPIPGAEGLARKRTR